MEPGSCNFIQTGGALHPRFGTMGPQHGPVMWNPHKPSLYHIQMGAQRTDPTRISKGPRAAALRLDKTKAQNGTPIYRNSHIEALGTKKLGKPAFLSPIMVGPDAELFGTQCLQMEVSINWGFPFWDPSVRDASHLVFGSSSGALHF